jgi:N-methylhydantoinase A
VDAGGRLHVGPESAGAEPGPACFGKGGQLPTVTDANLYLGLLGDSLLGGAITADREAAGAAIDRHVAEPLGMSTMEAAAGIFRIVNNAMASGIREVSIARGHDPRDFVLIAFGGAGAIHASRQAKELGIKRVLVPKAASVLCALGDVLSDVLVTRNRGYYARASTAKADELEAVLRGAAEEGLLEVGSVVDGALDVQIESFLEMHYVAQTHELLVPAVTRMSSNGSAPSRTLVFDSDCLAETIRGFHDVHERLYTFSKPQEDIEILGVRVDVRVVLPKPEVTAVAAARRERELAPAAHRPVFLEDHGDFVEIPIYSGPQMQPGDELYGPLVIEEPDTTVVVYPGDVVRVLPDQSYEILVGERS